VHEIQVEAPDEPVAQLAVQRLLGHRPQLVRRGQDELVERPTPVGAQQQRGQAPCVLAGVRRGPTSHVRLRA